MEIPDYLDLMDKVSYIEGMIRMVENYGDSAPLEYVLRDPQMENLICRHFYCESGQEFLRLFSSPDDFHKIMDIKFAGENLLFHTRKIRSEHSVPNTHMIYCIRGSCLVRVRDDEISLHPGDTCIVAREVPHAYYNASETSLVLHVVLTTAFISNVLFPRLPQEHLRSGFFRSIVFDESSGPDYVYVAGSKPNETTYFLSSAFYHHLYRPPMHEEIINSFMLLFFSYQMQAMSRHPELVDSPTLSPEQTLQQIQSYIGENCRTVTLRQLAERFHFNESYLSQYLRKNTGKTFTALLQNARISLAAKLLINTTLSIVDIADKVGYQNMSYFYKLFTEVNQCSPAEYRARFLKSGQRVIGHETI